MNYVRKFDPSSPILELRAVLDRDDVMIAIVPRSGDGGATTVMRHVPIAPEAIFRQVVARFLVTKLDGLDAELIAECTNALVAEFANLLPDD